MATTFLGPANTLLTSKIVEFSRVLRQAGVGTTPRETIDAAVAVNVATPSSLDELQYVLRSALVKSPEHYPFFEKIFWQFWRDQTVFTGPLTSEEPEERLVDIRPELNLSSLVTERQDQTQAIQVVALYSPFASLATKKFGKLDHSRGFVIKRNVRLLLRKLATSPGRRFSPALRGELDLRRMMRRGLGTHGQLVRLLHRRRKLTRSPIVLFCDVSGSMEGRSEELLMLMHAVQNSVSKAETFVFSTDLVRVSEWLRARSLREAANIISHRIKVWGSGTRIGYCLAAALKFYGHFISRDSTVIIISDGWDVGDLNLLSLAMNELRRQVAQIIWLNPHADEPSFKPATGGLNTALRFVDLHEGLSILYSRSKLLHSLAGIAAE